MPIIQELDSHVVNVIAAGEVVERPASAAKELLENAIDAGATRIAIEIQSGGIAYLRVTDNGCGMAREDAEIAFRRHATSKLRKETDLQSINTLGFRGEALAAMAAVARVDLLTKQAGNLAGTHVHIEGGDLQIVEEAGCPEGTTIILRDLFFNTPVRMKFLKKDYTEAGYIVTNVQQQALSHPEIAFQLIRDGKTVFSTDGKGDLENPIYTVFGRELHQNMMEVPLWESDGYACYGHISKPHACRAQRNLQSFFVNGRSVRSQKMQVALEEAYRHSMITGKYPYCCLFLTVPLSQVDVNVHPAKTEVKFAREKQVFDVIYVACKNALEANDNTPNLTQASFATQPVVVDTPPAVQQELVQQEIPIGILPVMQQMAEREELPSPFAVKSSPSSRADQPIPMWEREPADIYGDLLYAGEDLLQPKAERFRPDREYVEQVKQMLGEDAKAKPAPAWGNNQMARPHKPLYSQLPAEEEPVVCEEQTTAGVRIVGEIFSTYIIAEDAQGVWLVDKHAAHERVLFNKLRAQGQVSKQELLCTEVVELSPVQHALLCEHIDVLDTLGFTLESFGTQSVAVRAVPSYLTKQDIGDILAEIAHKLQNGQPPTPDRWDDMAHSIACRAAIKAGKDSQPAELLALCQTILNDPEVHSCPHGRPVTVRLSKYELDKMFKRVNQ